ncbi:hypothetical protein GF376_03010 [Candidatus Peregrinibacteria bacterium]|nr:hypothetical protein [Candidatus Peregrinibacteria bacterium]
MMKKMSNWQRKLAQLEQFFYMKMIKSKFILRKKIKLDLMKKQTNQIKKVEFEKAFEIIKKSEQIAIISHRNPDPDAIGSNLALREVLERMGKNVVSACVDKPPENSDFIIKNRVFEKKINLQQFDLIITVDCGSIEQTAYPQLAPDLPNFNPIINIDHHASNNLFGTINLHSKTISSTCEIIYQTLQIWKQEINPSIATALLFGIYFDTGSFMHTNTTAETLEIAEKLYQAGADKAQIVDSLFKNFNERKFKLWGEVLSSFKITEQNSIVSAVTIEDVQKYKCNGEELSGIIDYLSTGNQCNYAILVNETDQDIIKGSLRTQHEQFDMSKIAGKLGGGGHKKASGFSIPGKIQKQIVWKIQN